ncbi:hypothetical protein F4774DRAFT_428897 [Daldinia eschscholtzii]|nr:hypothetical protein F4774DRAFT_428897 [Daldinia eschscholtzii]
MGHCMSTCGGRRKTLVASDIEIRNVSIRVITLPGNNGEDTTQPQQYASDMTMPLVGIALTSNVAITAPAPISDKVVLDHDPNQDPGGSSKLVVHEMPTDKDMPIEKDSHSLTESLRRVSINDIHVETATPVNFSRPVQHRLMTSTSAYNIRDLGDTITDNTGAPRLRPSATMGNLNKPLSNSRHEIAIKDYVNRQNSELEKYWKIIAPDKASLVDYNRDRDLTRRRPVRELETISGDEFEDIPLGDDDDGKNGGVKPAEDANEESGTGPAVEANGENEEAKALVHKLRQKAWQWDERILHLDAERALARTNTSTTGNVSSSNELVEPPTAGQSSYAPRFPTGTSCADILALRRAKVDVKPYYYIGSPRVKARVNHFPPPGSPGLSTSTTFPVPPPTAPDHAAPAAPAAPIDSAAAAAPAVPVAAVAPMVANVPKVCEVHEIPVVSAVSAVPNHDNEKNQKAAFRPVKSGLVPSKRPRITMPRLYTPRTKERDNALYMAAYKKVSTAYRDARPEIRNRVRQFIKGEHTISKACETILAMDDDVIDSCIHGENCVDVVRRLVEGCCEDAEVDEWGLVTPALQAQLDTEAEATMRRKTAALMAKWVAEAEEKEKAQEKGKEKEKTD